MKGIPVILLSEAAAFGSRDREKACNMGAADCIAKFFDSPAFIATIEKHI
ncbi:MAG: hypothetical protein FWC36_01110 [Spirochaetes bacterium]|nr:hypothetical protein [Spirochaetota bacterium]